jgi:hypothetical protein
MLPANTTPVSYPYGAMNFIATLAFRILIAKSRTRWHGIFNGLSEDGEQADLSKNLRVSLFDK